eukprot:jgi/Bigna1/87373/estExt_fgenesh1_pg.C_190197
MMMTMRRRWRRRQGYPAPTGRSVNTSSTTKEVLPLSSLAEKGNRLRAYGEEVLCEYQTSLGSSNVPLKRLQLLVSRRLNRAAKLCRVKPPNTNNDAILKTMGLPDIRAILTSFAKEGEQTKVTSRKDFNNLANKGYFAILKLGNEFLIRFYETRSHNSSSSSAKHKPAPRRQNNKQPHSGQQQQQQQTGRGTAANNSSSSRRTRTRGYYGDEDDYVNNARPLSLLNRKIAFCEAGIGGRARGRHGEEQPSNLVILDAQALSDRNKGFTMLKSMGWREGFGLGSKGQGVVEPPPVRFTMTRGF